MLVTLYGYVWDNNTYEEYIVHKNKQNYINVFFLGKLRGRGKVQSRLPIIMPHRSQADVSYYQHEDVRMLFIK